MCGKSCAHSKKEAKALDKRINDACYKGLQGLSVNVFDLSKVSKEAAKLCAAGLSDEDLTAKLYQFALSLPQTKKTIE